MRTCAFYSKSFGRSMPARKRPQRATSSECLQVVANGHNRKLARGQGVSGETSDASSPTNLSTTTEASYAEASHTSAASPREAPSPQAPQAPQAAASSRRIVPRSQTWQSTVPVQRTNFVRAQTWTGHELHSVPEGGSLPSAALVFLLPIVPDQAAGAFQRSTNVPEHRP
eukprot:Skav235806  [mRNA]  locus=scaffold1267:264257:265730:- [translate_table: standard]